MIGCCTRCDAKCAAGGKARWASLIGARQVDSKLMNVVRNGREGEAGRYETRFGRGSCVWTGEGGVGGEEDRQKRSAHDGVRGGNYLKAWRRAARRMRIASKG